MKKLNFLLVMPRLVQTIGDGYVFPLGIAYVSASLKKAGINVTTVNLNHQEGKLVDILSSLIEENDIDIVGTGGLSPQYHLVRNVLKTAKDISPEIITVVGGGMITAEARIAMKALEYADYGVIGEGELSAVELVQALEADAPVEEIKKIEGLIIRDSGNTFSMTPSRADIEDLEAIPWADYEGFDVEKYLDLPAPAFGGLNAKRMLPMLASRSCPYNCTFCFHSLGSKYRRRSHDDFFAELDYLTKRYDIDYLSMADELFEPKKERVIEFCERIKPYGLRWHADFAVNNVRPEILPIMKEGGLDVMFFGLESADDNILVSMKKRGLTMEKMEAVLKIVTEHDIPVYGAFIFGDKEETFQSAQKTMKWWREHPEYLVHLTLIKPFPGSQIYTYACEKGIITDKEKYLKDGCPQVNISKMNGEEFGILQRQISDAMDDLERLEDVRLISLNSEMGRMTISGKCPQCSNENTFDDLKMFALDYLTCPDCIHKFHIPVPDEVLANINLNLNRLMAEEGKIAVWGMTLTMMELFKESETLRDPRVFPVDIAETKRRMDLYGKQVSSPDVINEEEITVAVITVPSHIGQITSQIEENHTSVVQILDICELVGSELPEMAIA
ncbi:MAG: radical SAM protein [Gammaproteobacteria bacterium]|jgi:anaerobic magnesium-protoporphyrin IX monomethyl ester cyclase|nr:radical SAM protein [Gammaproteobacteria bacterium]MBT4491722.1 radical SAM protein [Gammaproteobacteria bacterium]